MCCLSAFWSHSPEVRMITFQGHHPHIQYNNSISSLQLCSSQKSPLVLSSSFLRSLQGKGSRQRIEREQCDYCQECLPPGQNWRQGMSHHVIFKVHLLWYGCQQCPKTPFLKQEAKEDTEYNFISIFFTVFYFY